MSKKKKVERGCDKCAHAGAITKSYRRYGRDRVYCLQLKKTVEIRNVCVYHWTMTCYNCEFCNGVKFKGKKKVKDDDGGIHYRHMYKWEIECSKEEDKIVFDEEGTVKRATIPSCSLWKRGRNKYD